MTNPVIKVENLSKYYRLGVISGGTLREDISRWWARKRGKTDPYSKIGEATTQQPRGGQIWALEDINLEVREGEILGIIGRNGAGKSTLLKILSKITAPTSGTAIMKGRVGSLLEVGTGFHPELTGRENIYLNGAILGLRRSEVTERLESIIEFAEVRAFVDTPVKRYSSGMMVRLAFSVAAHLEPEILFVDEVLAVGDIAFQEKCIGKMDRLSRDGRTVLFVSHNLPLIQNLTSRCAYLEKGKIKAIGETREVLGQYRDDSDRSGNGSSFSERSIIRRVEIVSGEAVRSSLEMGAPVKIRLYYSSEVSFNGVHVGIGVRNAQGARVVSFSTYYSLPEGIDIDGDGVITCDVGSIPLNAGVYSISIAVASNVGPTGKDIERHEDVKRLVFVESDIFGTGRIPDSSRGQIVWPVRWRIE